MEMLEYMRKMDILRKAPGAEALVIHQKQTKMASFLCPIDQDNGHSTTIFEGPTETFQGLILEETVSANLDSRENTQRAKGGSLEGPVSSYWAEKK